MSNYENFDEQKQFACRLIADHARSTAFAIADGILPGNEGRNYVLRKIMRRAIYHGREHFGFNDLFFHKVCGFVVDQMKDAYPELAVQKDFIDKMVRLEEERFGNTLTVGLRKLDDLINSSFSEERKESVVATSELAKLYDTFGTPIDLMYVILSQKKTKLIHRVKFEENYIPSHNQIINIEDLDEENFRGGIEKLLKELQQEGGIGKTKQAEKINPIYTALQRTSVKSNFHGYDKTEVEGAKVLALVKNDERVDALDVDDEGLIILNETPFYAESGGQVGDVGVIFPREQDGDSQIKVFDTFAPIAGIVLHKSKVEKGAIQSRRRRLQRRLMFSNGMRRAAIIRQRISFTRL